MFTLTEIPPIEICEVASMSMELLGNEYLEEFYPAPEATRARAHPYGRDNQYPPRGS
jgi:oligoendopeptidase F